MGPTPDKAEGNRNKFSLRNLKTFDSFRNPVYTLYYCGTAGQWASGSMQMVARSLLIYRLTGSGAILGLMALAQALPVFFLSLFGGVIADRLQKKYVILIGQTVRGMAPLGVALALHTGYMSIENTGSWWVLLASAALQGVVAGLMQPSSQAILRDIVDEEKVMNAVSLANMGQNAFQLIGPAVGGFLIEAFDFKTVYYIIAGINLLGVMFFLFMPITRRLNTGISNPLKDIPEGFGYVRRNTIIWLVLLFALISSMLGMPIMQMLPMFTEDILGVGAGGLGLMMSCAGLGAITGSLIFASLPGKKRGTIFLLSGVFIGIILVMFSLSSNWHLSLVLIVAFGLARSGKTTLENALLQSYAGAQYRGRVLSLLTMQMSFYNFGTFLAGLLAEAVGVQWTIGSLAAGLAVISAAMWLSTPLLRKLQ